MNAVERVGELADEIHTTLCAAIVDHRPELPTEVYRDLVEARNAIGRLLATVAIAEAGITEPR